MYTLVYFVCVLYQLHILPLVSAAPGAFWFLVIVEICDWYHNPSSQKNQRSLNQEMEECLAATGCINADLMTRLVCDGRCEMGQARTRAAMRRKNRANREVELLSCHGLRQISLDWVIDQDKY